MKDKATDIELTWSFREKSGWVISSDPPRNSVTKELSLPVKLEVTEHGRSHCYIAGRFEVNLLTPIIRAQVSLELTLTGADNAEILFGLSHNIDRRKLVFKRAFILDNGSDKLEQSIGLSQTALGKYYGLIHVYLPPKRDCRILISSAKLCMREASGLDINRLDFATFGDRTKASSRLRAFKIGEAAERHGIVVAYNLDSTDPDASKQEEPDVVVFQKVRPFSTLKSLAPKPVRTIFDFDDHIGLEGKGAISDLVAFLDCIDLVTVGSEHLARFARQFHPCVKVLENPVDIATTTCVRKKTGTLRKICWFGAPEGLRQLERAKIATQITTITTGGDIPFDLDNIDDILVRFDLCIMPLELSEWNLAKNANRMIKAIGLGIPVLASASPEHARVAAQLGLGEQVLVSDGQNWDDHIAKLATDFVLLEEATLKARDIVLQEYSADRIVEEWLGWIRDAPRRSLRGGRRSLNSASHAQQASTSVIIFGGVKNELTRATIELSEISWLDFARRTVVRPGRTDNTALEYSSFKHVSCKSPMDVCRAVDVEISSSPDEWILLIPSGYLIKTSAALAFEATLSEDCNLIPLGCNARGSVADAQLSGTFDMVDAMSSPAAPGPLLVRTSWLRQKRRFSTMLGYYCWYLCLVAAAEGGGYRPLEFPASVRTVGRGIESSSIAQQEWLRARDPSELRELPSVQGTWERMSLDILYRCFADLGGWSSAAAAAAIVQLQKLKKEL